MTTTTPIVFLLTDKGGREYRYERYPVTTSQLDRMLAEDSACKAFERLFGYWPATVAVAR